MSHNVTFQSNVLNNNTNNIIEMVETHPVPVYQDTSTISVIAESYQPRAMTGESLPPAMYFGDSLNANNNTVGSHNESIQRKKYTQKELEEIYTDRSKVPARALAAMVALCCVVGLVGLAVIVAWRLRGDEDDFVCDGTCEVNFNSLTRICNNGSGCCADTYVSVSQLVRGVCTKRDQGYLLGLGIAMMVVAVVVPMFLQFCKEKVFSGLTRETFDFRAAAGIPTSPQTPFRNTAPCTILLSGHSSVDGTYRICPGDIECGYPVWSTNDGRVLSSTHSAAWIISLNSEKIAQSVPHCGRYPDQLTDPSTWQVMIGESWIPIEMLDIIQAYDVGEQVEVQLKQTPPEWVSCSILEVTKGDHPTNIHYRIRIHQTERFGNAYGYSDMVWPNDVSPTLLRRTASRSLSPSRAIRTPPRTEPFFEAKQITIRDSEHNNSIQVTVVQHSNPDKAMTAMLKRLKLEGNYSLTNTNMQPVQLDFASVDDGAAYNLCSLDHLHKDEVEVQTTEGGASDTKSLPIVITPQGLLSNKERHLPRAVSNETTEDVGALSTTSSSLNGKIDLQFGHPDVEAPIYAPPKSSQYSLPPTDGGYRSRFGADGNASRRIMPRRSTVEFPSNMIKDDISEKESTANSSVRRDQVMDLQARIEERLQQSKIR